jgi:hypothetical protein
MAPPKQRMTDMNNNFELSLNDLDAVTGGKDGDGDGTGTGGGDGLGRLRALEGAIIGAVVSTAKAVGGMLGIG